jgi:predicted O-methyltransferase YrrM
MEEIVPRTTVEKQLERSKSEGWIYRGDMATEGEVLELIHAIIRITKPEICVETGTYHAHGTQAIANGLQMNGKGKVWTVEAHDDYEYSPHDFVEFIQADSVEWTANEAPKNIDFAFVDCGPPDVRIKAFTNLLPKMAPDGIIMVHDTAFYESKFLEQLSMAYGCPPNFNFPALNGVVGWQS